MSEPDRGVYDAMNKGLRLCRGDFVIFMNAGDEFFNPRVLERAAAVRGLIRIAVFCLGTPVWSARTDIAAFASMTLR